MPNPLENRHIALGVTGSIACYKSVDLASKLTQAGALVDVLMTPEATKFLAPLTFRSITHRPVITDIFAPESELSINHVAVAERADVVIVAPATANTIAKLAHGLADDPVTTTVLATRAPVIVAPAMDANMYENAATQQNVAALQGRGYIIAGPASGRLASGLIGLGRMLETPDLLGCIKVVLGRDGDLANRKVVVSAGGTQEPIDPVRVIANHSTGKMGYALAEAARDRGADVSLVTTPTALEDPYGVNVIKVRTALEMRSALLHQCSNADALIMAAAVADWRPTETADHKLKKGDSDTWSIDLVKNPDILAEISGEGLIKVGFAAESEDLIANAQSKLVSKGLHLIVANNITAPDSGFGTDTNRVTLVDREGRTTELPLLTKYEVGHEILDRVAKVLA
ncbi:MAG: bifunctional 4'-phosphopantothenoylcysteine decarboxylase/phosphopantothenoylcysteine synthetase [SAR202 cluster bacterium Casp-Chloro-G4]|nr:bifunctional phosphopantothenoylcysteine decarboxylase/phosphopantothenate--cysteine ligase CoaBC [Chloroflexota bacterium]MDA1227595.1 bifunctional phosphopantothenoylcysteine decarboxylase/phosphopantothenate--cysteine ligase CoaBC [Chloroflexota bacterium]PKB60997.1 MAG: bifunctional 4'-phosphopantothenoylcysteine decarboxylase/phosphopantothenoylcysteine synthetase [SAR202 cluster bacterium Casp-Chloro-G4]